MKVAFHTLGCKVNQDDTQGLAKRFLDRGYQVVPFQSGADIYVINTCSVTGVGEQKSRQMIRRAHQLNPEAVIAVTGCYAQTSPQVIAEILGVNLVIGMAERPRIVELVEAFLSDRENRQVVAEVHQLESWVDLPLGDSTTGGALQRTRASLKIEEGCEQFCSYCIVPYARGGVRSMPPEQVIKSFRNLVAQGYREIVLTGIHLGAYGKDLGLCLNDILRQVVTIKGDFRIRLGSIEPLDLTDALLETVLRESRICPSFHIPLQSGCNKILEMMKRGYERDFFALKIDLLRRGNPMVAIGTDLIVGFPGETEADFEETRLFVAAQQFSRIHIFRYSPRQGTPAAALSNRIPETEKARRSKIIQELACRSAVDFAARFAGQEVAVLFEEPFPGGWTGLSGEYLTVRYDTGADLKNQLRRVVIANNQDECLLAKRLV